MGRAILVVLMVVLLVYALFDLRSTPTARVQHLPKVVWALVILLPLVGPLLWLVVGQRAPKSPGGGRSFRPPRPKGPDDDPDYLRGL